MLEIRGLYKTFGKGTVNEHTALKNVSLTVKDDDFVTMLGSNGAGKSTLFGAIAGTFLVDAGQIILDGKDVTFMPDYKRARKIGMLFQDPLKGTAPDMTIEENLSLAYNQSYRFPLAKAVQKKDLAVYREKLAAFEMGLEDRMKMKVGLLSGGQRQALTLLMATIAQPHLLLLDEHTAALDPATAEKVLKITVQIVREQKIPTMMITHNMQSALSVGNRTVMMDAGEVILDISGDERAQMQVTDLMNLYAGKRGKLLDNDRMLLSHT
ncbi:MAG: ATP-binding cassette domain-containing protein [Clostridiales bacterium]|nr:ATP-binding cassette domain-containing protein [Clostridiales bacterium]